MATQLDVKKMKAELLGVSHAKAMLEIRIDEMKEEALRLSAHIEIQSAKEKELKQKISDIEASLKA
jgi:predicted  nucleic acid-binding Zn-ribbon protein